MFAALALSRIELKKTALGKAVYTASHYTSKTCYGTLTAVWMTKIVCVKRTALRVVDLEKVCHTNSPILGTTTVQKRLIQL